MVSNVIRQVDYSEVKTQCINALNQKLGTSARELETVWQGIVLTAGLSEAFGAWTELLASVGTSKVLIGLSILGFNRANVNYAEIEIGEGASGSEIVITRCMFGLMVDTIAGYGSIGFIPLYRELTNNARLSARLRASVDSYQIRITPYIKSKA